MTYLRRTSRWLSNRLWFSRIDGGAWEKWPWVSVAYDLTIMTAAKGHAVITCEAVRECVLVSTPLYWHSWVIWARRLSLFLDTWLQQFKTLIFLTFFLIDMGKKVWSNVSEDLSELSGQPLALLLDGDELTGLGGRRRRTRRGKGAVQRRGQGSIDLLLQECWKSNKMDQFIGQQIWAIFTVCWPQH